MKTYDSGAATHGTRPYFKSLKGVVVRFFDRERELISLRNAVGMMSEARRRDAKEYDEMREGILQLKAKNKYLLNALKDIAGSTNLTATPKQFAECLQRIARDAIDV